MKEWILNTRYGITPYKLRAALEYESNQIMRIRVYGKINSLLLENDYPIAQHSKRGIKWKIREGSLFSRDSTSNEKNARFLTDIMDILEHYIKGKDQEPTKAEYLQRTKL